MLRSMYSGVTGLKANQIKLDVIGNNISNVSTTAFKTQTIRFKDSLSQTIGYSASASNNLGGTNPKQVGIGVQVAGISTTMSQGNLQTTGSNLDCAIDGDGYFIVATGPLPKGNDLGVTVDNIKHDITKVNNLLPRYTRDGSFTLDADGSLLTSDGYRILGYALTDGANTSIQYSSDGKSTCNYVDANVDGGVKGTGIDKEVLLPLKIPDSVTDGDKKVLIKNFSIEKDGIIKATLDDGRTTVLGQIAMANFKNPAGLEKQGKNLYMNGPNSGEATIRSVVGSSDDNSLVYGACLNGYLEMSNVDLADQFTEMIVASRAFQANGKMITTGDEILQDLVNLKR